MWSVSRDHSLAIDKEKCGHPILGCRQCKAPLSSAYRKRPVTRVAWDSAIRFEAYVRARQYHVPNRDNTTVPHLKSTSPGMHSIFLISAIALLSTTLVGAQGAGDDAAYASCYNQPAGLFRCVSPLSLFKCFMTSMVPATNLKLATATLPPSSTFNIPTANVQSGIAHRYLLRPLSRSRRPTPRTVRGCRHPLRAEYGSEGQ